jgi:hypothetical protein
MASPALHGDLGHGVAMMPPRATAVRPVAWWEDDPVAVAKEEIRLQNHTPIRSGAQIRGQTGRGLMVWHRMLGRTYCLI